MFIVLILRNSMNGYKKVVLDKMLTGFLVNFSIIFLNVFGLIIRCLKINSILN